MTTCENQMSIRDKRVEHELLTYPLMDAQPEPWGDILTLTVPAYHLRVEVPRQYPYRAPTFYVNGENVLVRLKRQYVDVLILLRPYRFDFPCVCCRMLLSSSRWSPISKIEEAVDDYLAWTASFEAITNYCDLKPRLKFDDLIDFKILQYLLPKIS
jgi:hypothetical protein